LKSTLQSIRTTLNIPTGTPIPIGIGFLGWILDKTELSEDPRLIPTLDQLPTAIWFAFGNDLQKYIIKVRQHDDDDSNRRLRSHKTIIFVIVNSVMEALRAANEWKVDVIVVQGIEAGGHGGAKAPFLSTLLQAVITAIPNGPPIIATGGITTGAQIAALLTQGATGVALGTRFLYTNECQYSPTMKQVLLSSNINSTERSVVFDEVNRTMGWPEGVDGRAISNEIIKDHLEGIPLEERLKRFDQSKSKGDKNRLVIWAGAGVGITNKIMNTTDVFNELHQDTVNCLKAVSHLLV